MITFTKEGPKEWQLNLNNIPKIKLDLVSSSITNKFVIITTFIENMSQFHGLDFDTWLLKLLDDCKDEDRRSFIVSENIPKLKEYVDSYLNSLQLNFHQFVNESKAKKGSILFMPDEISKIITLSSYLKVYSLISNNENLRLGQRSHYEIYNKIAAEILETDIVYKIFNIVKTKTYRYNQTDKYMWDYLKTIQCKDIGVHVIEIFNFIMNNILVLCEETKNPITYFVGVIDESVKWFLRSVYKGSIVYDDSVSTEDIHGINVDNLKTYSYNDTLGRLKQIALRKIDEELERTCLLGIDKRESDELTTDFHKRSDSIKYVSPLAECLVFPILSKITKIPYYHFKTLSPQYSAILSCYLKMILLRVFKADYKNLFQLLDYFPMISPSLTTTYKIKNINQFLNFSNEVKNFFGYNNKIFSHKVISHFIGRISRMQFCNILDGKKTQGLPMSKLETDMWQFFTLYFAGKLDDKIKEVAHVMYLDF